MQAAPASEVTIGCQQQQEKRENGPKIDDQVNLVPNKDNKRVPGCACVAVEEKIEHVR